MRAYHDATPRCSTLALQERPLAAAGVLEFVYENLLNTVVQEKLQVTGRILSQDFQGRLFEPNEVKEMLLPTSSFIRGYCAGD